MEWWPASFATEGEVNRCQIETAYHISDDEYRVRWRDGLGERSWQE